MRFSALSEAPWNALTIFDYLRHLIVIGQKNLLQFWIHRVRLKGTLPFILDFFSVLYPLTIVKSRLSPNSTTFRLLVTLVEAKTCHAEKHLNTKHSLQLTFEILLWNLFSLTKQQSSEKAPTQRSFSPATNKHFLLLFPQNLDDTMHYKCLQNWHNWTNDCTGPGQ